MIAEVIIACRQEIPAILERTVDNILDTLGKGDRITVVLDGETQPEYNLPEAVTVLRSPWDVPLGCGPCRDYGASQSEAAVIVFVDAHMLFPAEWLKVIKTHLKARPKDVTCAHMRSLNTKWEPMAGQVYHGARLVTHCQEPGGQFWGLAAKWGKVEKESGTIGACMGACYGMKRKHYVEGMGAPLSILRAWGGDEELLSVCTWLAGGNVYLLPLEVGHMYAAPHTREPISDGEAAAVWGNRLAILDVLPISDKAKADLELWLRRTNIPWDSIAESLVNRPDIDALAAHLGSLSRPWGTFARHYLERATVKDTAESEAKKPVELDAGRRDKYRPPAAPKGDVSQVVVRTREQCQRCNALGTFRQTEGFRDFGSFKQASARCIKCGHKGTIRVV